MVKTSQEEIEPEVKEVVTAIDRKYLWLRITQAFNTEEVQKIADKLELSYQSVYKWQKGKFPSRDTLEKISTLTGSSIEWLLTGRGSQYFQKVTLTGHPDDHIEDYILYGIDDQELRDSILAVLEVPGGALGADVRELMQEWVRDGFTRWQARRSLRPPQEELEELVRKVVREELEKAKVEVVGRARDKHEPMSGELYDVEK